MLAAPHRLRRRSDFLATVRHGRRASGGPLPGAAPLVVVHLWAGGARRTADGAHRTAPPQSEEQSEEPCRVGFVVSRSVGGSVVRSAVTRRLRHVLMARLAGLAPGDRLVVRAMPGSARSTSAELTAAVDLALRRLRPKVSA